MAHAFVEDNILIYKKLFKTCRMDTGDIVWAYLQQEDANARLCCGTASFPIGRLIVLDKNGNKEVFQYEGMEEPKKLLEDLKRSNSSMDIGYNDENVRKHNIKNEVF